MNSSSVVINLPEDRSIGLHGLLHVQPDLSSREGTVRLPVKGISIGKHEHTRMHVPDLVKVLNAVETNILRQLRVRLARGERLLDVGCASTAEDDDVQERVRAKTVGAVDGYASSLTGSVQTRDDLVIAVLVLRDNLTGVTRRNTTHCNGLLAQFQVFLYAVAYCCSGRWGGRGWAPW